MIPFVAVCMVLGAFAGVVYADVRDRRSEPVVIPGVGLTVPQARAFLAKHRIAVAGRTFTDGEVVEIITLWKQGRNKELNELQNRLNRTIR